MIVLGEPSLDARGGDVTADVSDIISEGPLSLRMGDVMGKLARRNPGWCVMRVARVGCGVGNLLTREHDQIERERETARHPERVLDMLSGFPEMTQTRQKREVVTQSVQKEPGKEQAAPAISYND